MLWNCSFAHFDSWMHCLSTTIDIPSPIVETPLANTRSALHFTCYLSHIRILNTNVCLFQRRRRRVGRRTRGIRRPCSSRSSSSRPTWARSSAKNFDCRRTSPIARSRSGSRTEEWRQRRRSRGLTTIRSTPHFSRILHRSIISTTRRRSGIRWLRPKEPSLGVPNRDHRIPTPATPSVLLKTGFSLIITIFECGAKSVFLPEFIPQDIDF